ncbi:MAG: inorganic diphosphatase [Bacteroidota bacterium]
MKNLFHIPIGERAPEEINAVIEIPKLSRNKYEYDPEIEAFRLDRVLSTPLIYPADYGFIPQTLAGDGDPVDVLILMEQPTFTGCVTRVRPLGVLQMSDEKGEDTKLLAVPATDRRYDNVERLADLSRHVLAEIEHFFIIYKELDGEYPAVAGWLERDHAFHYLQECHRNYAGPADVESDLPVSMAPGLADRHARLRERSSF